MRITRIISTAILNGLRVLTHSPFKDVTKSNELLSPFGIDANPYPGIKAFQVPATTNGRGAIIGFYSKHNISDHGEIRILSTDPEGNAVLTSIYLKNDGTILIAGDIFHTGNLNIQGDINIDGDINVDNGSINVTNGDVVADGISLKNHDHNYTDNGVPGFVTGPPN